MSNKRLGVIGKNKVLNKQNLKFLILLNQIQILKHDYSYFYKFRIGYKPYSI